jgi:uncharacterized membrane protein HdeD (DUF308 family)
MAGELEGETFEHRGPLETGTLRYIRGAGTGMIVVGAVCLICGVIAVVWPKITLLALAILILSWPKISLGTLAVLAGIAFILRGALMVYGGIQVRRAAATT